jgi:hypothetical protein
VVVVVVVVVSLGFAYQKSNRVEILTPKGA